MPSSSSSTLSWRSASPKGIARCVLFCPFIGHSHRPTFRGQRVAELASVRWALVKDPTSPSWTSFKSIHTIRKEITRLEAANEAMGAAATEAEIEIAELNLQLSETGHLQTKVEALERDLEAAKRRQAGGHTSVDRQALMDVKSKHHESKGRWRARLETAEVRVHEMVARESKAKESWDAMGTKLAFLQGAPLLALGIQGLTQKLHASPP